ncbi:hypothetical protein [Sulfitobacter delicatus]|uniref:Uncharacterized protein n=1 Tax=Sulfitobacter delicatus TaxID=218672 RepID=A0A1G7QZC1_9RHOB|nr:hypothetical protein [Sulfitobacter delicatus]SDG03872.1 hypothetical protein SAMN04489759_104217 [Sulfitobacter delicatus]
MDTEDDPEIIFSEYTQAIVIQGHHFDVEIYKTTLHPGWILSVENEFGTLTISDDPPYLADGLAWRAFQALVSDEGIKAFFNKNEQRKLRL